MEAYRIWDMITETYFSTSRKRTIWTNLSGAKAVYNHQVKVGNFAWYDLQIIEYELENGKVVGTKGTR